MWVRYSNGWIINHDAKVCGEGVAVINASVARPQIETELEKLVDDSTRLCVVGWEEEKEKILGRFLKGGRKAAPWRGFAEDDSDRTDE